MDKRLITEIAAALRREGLESMDIVSTGKIVKAFTDAVSDANTYANFEVRLEVLNNLADDLAVAMFVSEIARDNFKRACGLDDWSA